MALRAELLEGNHERQAQDDEDSHQSLQAHVEVLDGAAQQSNLVATNPLRKVCMKLLSGYS